MIPVMRVLLCVAIVTAAQGSFRSLPPFNPQTVKPGMFADDELDLPYYVAHFARLANAVVEEGPDRGFIRIAVWRNEKDNQPYNARIMENILSLAYFYTVNRPWNPYYGAPGLRDRLEATLDFWVRIQSPEGAFSEYKPQGWNLAATAFATKFMGQTLRLLEKGPPLDPELMKRVRSAQRKAIHFVLTDPAFLEHGRNYSNQFTNVWPGALAWLSQHKDAEIESLLQKRIAKSATEFQSPAGYFYEAGGPDWAYNFGTHHSNLLGAWFYANGTPLGKHILEEERRFFEWVSYNVAPDGDYWVLNRGVETRRLMPVVGFSYRFPLAEHVPEARAFVPTREDVERRTAEKRRRFVETWPKVDPLPVGKFSAYSPYVFLHREQPQYAPSSEEKKAAAALMPVNARREFIHQRMDKRHPIVFTYVRRPGYYVAFNSGKQITRQQRLGLGLLWTPDGGVILQSQTNRSNEAWGTRGAGKAQVYEAGDVHATFSTGTPEPGARDLESQTLTVEYHLGESGWKRVVFERDRIRVLIEHPGEFIEQIPALGSGPRLEPASWSLEDTEIEVAGKRLRVLRLAGRDRLEYSIRFR
jgi:hypothetical protein